MKIRLPELKGEKLSRSFILRQARRGVVKIMERLGPDRLEWLVKNNRSLADFLSPDKERAYREQGKRWAWAAKVISDEDMQAMVPQWARDIVEKHGEEGRQWLVTQLQFVRSFLQS